MPEKKTSHVIAVKKSEFRGYRCYVTFSPVSVLAGGYALEEKIVADFARFSIRQLHRPRRGSLSKPRNVIGFDTEYSPSGELLTVGIADAGAAEAYEGKDIKKAVKVIRGARVVVGHSVGGDLDHLVRLGCAKNSWLRGINIRDSFLLARMCDENRGKGAYGLETLLLSEMNFSSWKDATAALLKKTGNAADWTPEQRMERCRLDAWATAVLAKHFEEKLK